MTDRRSVHQLPAMIVSGRHVEVLTQLTMMTSELIEGQNTETDRVDKLTDAVQSMSGHIRTLIDELTKLQGRELWMDNDDDIWHHHEGRMYPLTDEGEHVNVREMRHRARRVGAVLGMQKADNFPTFEQVDRLHGRLQRITELDVVKRHVRKLEARLSELEG